MALRDLARTFSRPPEGGRAFWPASAPKDWGTDLFPLALSRVALSAVLLGHVLTFDASPGHPEPGYVRPWALAVVALLALTGVVQLSHRFRRSRAFGIVGMVVDVVVVVALLTIYAFDPTTHLFAPVFLVLVETALVVGRKAAVAAWAVAGAGYVASEMWIARAYGTQDAFGSISVRLLIGLVLAATIGALVEELSRREAKYRALVEQIPALTYVEDIAGISNMKYVSPQVSDLLGYSPGDWSKDPDLWTKLVHPEERDRVLTRNAECIATGSPFREEYRLTARDGREVWVRDSATLVRDDAGRPQFWQGVMVDITELKRAEQALEEFRSIVQSSSDAIIGKTLDGVITSWNPGAERIYGYLKEEAEGRLISMLAPPERPDEIPQILERIKHGQRVDHYETVRMRKDGTRIQVSITVSPIHDPAGRITGASVVARDITDRKLAQEQLAHALDREKEASELLRAVDTMRNALLHAVAHDLRSPLAALLAAATLLQKDELPPEARRRMLEGLVEEVRKMDRLLSDLLDLERLERGILEPRRSPTDIGQLVRRVLADLDHLEGKPLMVEVDAGIAMVDEGKVERIVENLLVNATKHTPEGTPVWVRARRDNGGIIIAVEDAGSGVSEDVRESIFRPFERGSADSVQVPGSGLGLSLVSRFAELHGGRAWVETRTGGGASFRVYLPDPVPAEPLIRNGQAAQLDAV